MSWGEMKKAVNSTVGAGNGFKPLNLLTEKQRYDVEYSITDTLLRLIGDENERIEFIP